MIENHSSSVPKRRRWALKVVSGIILVFLAIPGRHIAARFLSLRDLGRQGVIVDGNRAPLIVRRISFGRWGHGLSAAECLWGACTRMEKVTLYSGFIEFQTEDGMNLDGLKEFPELQLLEIRGGRVQEESLTVLKHLPDLKYFAWLQFDDSDELNGHGLKFLKHCPQLQVVFLERIRTDGAFLDELPEPERLVELTITDSPYFDGTSLLRLRRYVNLQELNLLDCENIDCQSFTVFEHLRHLKSLAMVLPSEECRSQVAHIPQLSLKE